MKTCAIITGGDFAPLPDIDKADVVIACDKGLKYANSCGITPDLAVGDFDSFCPTHGSALKTITLPCEKDDTDVMYAIRYALTLAPESIALYCAEGGRPDHFLGNVQAMSFAAKQGVSARIYGKDSDYFFLTGGSHLFERGKNSFLSILSLSNRCGGVTLSGVKYPLTNGVIDNAFPIGVSNEWASDCAEISLKSGLMLVILTR